MKPNLRLILAVEALLWATKTIHGQIGGVIIWQHRNSNVGKAIADHQAEEKMNVWPVLKLHSVRAEIDAFEFPFAQAAVSQLSITTLSLAFRDDFLTKSTIKIVS